MAWTVPLRTSTHQIGELFDKVELLYKMGIHRNSPSAGLGHQAHLASHRMGATVLAIHTASTAFRSICRSMPFLDIEEFPQAQKIVRKGKHASRHGNIDD